MSQKTMTQLQFFPSYLWSNAFSTCVRLKEDMPHIDNIKGHRQENLLQVKNTCSCVSGFLTDLTFLGPTHNVFFNSIHFCIFPHHSGTRRRSREISCSISANCLVLNMAAAKAGHTFSYSQGSHTFFNYKFQTFSRFYFFFPGSQKCRITILTSFRDT